MKNKKINNMKYIDGKIHPEDSQTKDKKFEITTLEQLFSGTNLNRYHTLDPSEYESQLVEMNFADLREHAVKCGIIPRDVSQDKLKRQLLAEFNKYVSQYQKPSQKQRDIKVSKEVLDIMSTAR